MDYFGLPAIAQRLGVSQGTVIRWYVKQAFAMMQRQRGPRRVWYTNDALITAWQLKRCEIGRKAWIARPKRERRQTVAPQDADMRQTMK